MDVCSAIETSSESTWALRSAMVYARLTRHVARQLPYPCKMSQLCSATARLCTAIAWLCTAMTRLCTAIAHPVHGPARPARLARLVATTHAKTRLSCHPRLNSVNRKFLPSSLTKINSDPQRSRALAHAVQSVEWLSPCCCRLRVDNVSLLLGFVDLISTDPSDPTTSVKSNQSGHLDLVH